MSMTSSVDAQIQTNAADPEQVKEAGDKARDAELQDLADALAEIADYESRRRAFDRLDVLFRFGPVTESRLELGRFLARHDSAVALLARWRQHPRECGQMLMEGFKRVSDAHVARRSKRKQ